MYFNDGVGEAANGYFYEFATKDALDQDKYILLLQEIAKNTSTSDSLHASLITGAGVVIAAFISFLGIYFSAKMNGEVQVIKIKSEIITKERLRWLEAVRECVVRFYQEIDPLVHKLQHEPRLNQDEVNEIVKGANYHYGKLASLCSNVNEKQQNDIVVHLGECQVNIINYTQWLSCLDRKRNNLANYCYFLNILHKRLARVHAKEKNKSFDCLGSISNHVWSQIKDLK